MRRRRPWRARADGIRRGTCHVGTLSITHPHPRTANARLVTVAGAAHADVHRFDSYQQVVAQALRDLR